MRREQQLGRQQPACPTPQQLGQVAGPGPRTGRAPMPVADRAAARHTVRGRGNRGRPHQGRRRPQPRQPSGPLPLAPPTQVQQRRPAVAEPADRHHEPTARAASRPALTQDTASKPPARASCSSPTRAGAMDASQSHGQRTDRPAPSQDPGTTPCRGSLAPRGVAGSPTPGPLGDRRGAVAKAGYGSGGSGPLPCCALVWRPVRGALGYSRVRSGRRAYSDSVPCHASATPVSVQVRP